MSYDLSNLHNIKQRYRRDGTSVFLETYDNSTMKVIDTFEFTNVTGTIPNEASEVGKARLSSIIQGTNVPPGAFALTIKSTGYDQTAEIQQAANDMYATMGGLPVADTGRTNTGFVIKLVDGQDYALSNLVMPPGMSLTSVSGSYTPFSDRPAAASGGVPVSTGPVLRHINPNKPMIENDTVRGYTRGKDVRFSLNTIAGLVMVCDRFASTRRGDAPLVFWKSAFGLDFVGNSQFTSAGFGLKVVTCNAVRVRDNYCLYAPWFFFNVVDSQIGFNQVGGGNGYASDAVWISGDPDSGQPSRLCLLQNNLFYNNNSNGNTVSQFAHTANVTGMSSADTLKVDRHVGGGGDMTTNWVGETPVCFNVGPGGVLPTVTSGAPILETNTYWVTVMNDGYSVKLSRNRADRSTGTFISFSAPGNGCTLRVGGNANIHMNADTHNFMFMPIRSDQSFGDAILMNGAHDNVFQSLLVAFSRAGDALGNGYSKPIPGAGITLKNGSINNQFGSGVIDGRQHTDVGVGVSNQMYAFDVDASSRPGFDARGMRCSNHDAANSRAGARAYLQQDLNPRRMVIQPHLFTALTGSATVGIAATRRIALNISNSSSAVTNLTIPSEWLSVRARIRWLNQGITTGATQWGISVGALLENDDASVVDALQVSGASFTPAGGAADLNKLHESIVELGSTINLIAKQLSVRLSRLDSTGPVLSVLQVILEEAV